MEATGEGGEPVWRAAGAWGPACLLPEAQHLQAEEGRAWLREVGENPLGPRVPLPRGGWRLVAGAGGLPETTAQHRRQGWARPRVGSRPPHPPSTSFLFLWGYRKERRCRGEGGQQPRTPEALEQRLFPSTAEETSSGCRVGDRGPRQSTSMMGPCRRAAEGPAARQREDTLRDGIATMWPRWPGAASLLRPSGPLRGPRSS